MIMNRVYPICGLPAGPHMYLMSRDRRWDVWCIWDVLSMWGTVVYVGVYAILAGGRNGGTLCSLAS